MTTARFRSKCRPIAVVCALTLLAAACGGSGGATTTPAEETEARATVDDSSRFERFGAAMDALREQLRIPGMSVAVVRDRELAWAEGFGYADVARQVPATKDTPYHLASVSKPLAATVVMQLVEDGAVALDDTVAQFGVGLDGADEIRVWHLLTHTSEGRPGAVRPRGLPVTND